LAAKEDYKFCGRGGRIGSVEKNGLEGKELDIKESCLSRWHISRVLYLIRTHVVLIKAYGISM
jgi:hypothetical protein